MTRLLIVAATAGEMMPLISHYNCTDGVREGLVTMQAKGGVHLLITGVGMVNTACYTAKTLAHQSYSQIINAGICGAFKKQLQPGALVNVVQDTISEMGAEDGDLFIPYHAMNLGGTNVYSNRPLRSPAFLEDLPKVKGITVNKVHGNTEQIQKTVDLFRPDVESMEGAAFFRACQDSGAGFMQIRAVSNYVEKRDKSKWNIPLAIANLNDALIRIIEDTDQ